MKKVAYRITRDAILRAACSAWGVAMPQVLGRNRARRAVRARQTAYRLARLYRDETYEAIGEMFGGRLHTTILSGIRALEAEMESNMATRSFYAYAVKRLMMFAERIELVEEPGTRSEVLAPDPYAGHDGPRRVRALVLVHGEDDMHEPPHDQGRVNTFTCRCGRNYSGPNHAVCDACLAKRDTSGFVPIDRGRRK